jgi:hypothetical protein
MVEEIRCHTRIRGCHFRRLSRDIRPPMHDIHHTLLRQNDIPDCLVVQGRFAP